MGIFSATARVWPEFLANRANFADYSGYADRSDCAARCALRSGSNKPRAVDPQHAKPPLENPSRNAVLAHPWADDGADAGAFTLPGAMGQTSPQFPAINQAGSPANAAESKVEAYPLTAANRDVLTAWQQRAAGRTDMRVAIDERTSQALVFAPPSVQAQIQQELAAKNAVVAAPNVGLPGTNGAALFQLRQLPAGEVHQRLEGLLSRQLPATVDASGEWQSFQVETSPGVGVAMSVNTRSRQVRIDGPPAQVAAWRTVIDALDSPPAADKVTKIVNTKSASHDRVRQALEVLKTDGGARSPDNTSLISTIFQPHATTVAQAAPRLARRDKRQHLPRIHNNRPHKLHPAPNPLSMRPNWPRRAVC